MSINPQTIVYTINPKAVWSDGVPITAADFKYAWEQQRGDPDVPPDEVASIAGYRDIASVTGSNGGHTVTVMFKTTFADWQMLFANLVPAHVMEKVGWNPSCTTVDPAIDLSGGPFKIASVTPQAITLVQNPRWWGTPANARSITVHIASSTAQLAQWMASGYVQVAEPSTVTQSFLTQMTGLPGAQSEVDTSATLLQLDMASSLDSDLSPDLRFAIALTINRQDLVNQQVSWAVPGIAPGNSHLSVQGQQSYKPASTGSPTTTIPTPTSSTSTTTIGAGGSVNFPVTPVPAQAASYIAASGLVKTPGDPYYHSAFGTPFELHMVYDSSDPWAVRGGPGDAGRAGGGGPGHDAAPGGWRHQDGRGPGGRVRRPGGAAGDLHPLHEPDHGVVHDAPRAGGQERVTGLDGLLQQRVRPAGGDGLAAAEPGHGGHLYNQADTQLWDDMVSLPLFAEPTVLVWSRTIGGVQAMPRSPSLLWFAQLWAVRAPESTSNTTPSLPGQ